jgi:hypothetical protein
MAIRALGMICFGTGVGILIAKAYQASLASSCYFCDNG